jgi:hypothetical protein
MRRLGDCFLSSTKSPAASAPTAQISQPSQIARVARPGREILPRALPLDITEAKARKAAVAAALAGWLYRCVGEHRRPRIARRHAATLHADPAGRDRVSFIHVNEARMNAAFGIISARRWSSNRLCRSGPSRGRHAPPPSTAPMAYGLNHQCREGQCFTRK